MVSLYLFFFRAHFFLVVFLGSGEGERFCGFSGAPRHGHGPYRQGCVQDPSQKRTQGDQLHKHSFFFFFRVGEEAMQTRKAKAKRREDEKGHGRDG